MTKKEIIKRYIVFIIGLFVNSLGVAVITKANLGTSPISSIPYVLSLGYPFSLGEFTIVFNLLLIVLQILLLRKNFKKINLLQIFVAIGFGYFIDLSMNLLGSIVPSTVIERIVMLCIGCLILGFGVYIEVIADVIMLPGESFVRAVTQCFGTEFGITKICFDASMTIISGVLSFLLFHRLNGVGIGTIIAALAVGFLARQYGKYLVSFTEWLFGSQEKLEEEELEDQFQAGNVITIGREFGSGGREIGKLVAEKLGMKYYDSDILSMEVQASGKTQEYIEKNDEKVTGSLLFDIYRQINAYEVGEEDSVSGIFKIESDIIKDLAQKESCVIVGRLANFILADDPNAFHVFMHAYEKDKIHHVMERDHLSEIQAKHKIRTVEKERKDHCRLITGKEWGAARYYDMSINTSNYPSDKVAQLIVTLYSERTIA